MILQTEDAIYGQPEAIIDLKTATAIWSSRDRSTRKNVIEVSAMTDTAITHLTLKAIFSLFNSSNAPLIAQSE